MFDTLNDAAVIDAITAASREQNAASGRELLAIGEVYARRAPEDETERDNWAIDGHADVVAEISAALNISRHRASRRLDFAIDLRERLPEVGALFATGAIDWRMMAALVHRSRNVTDPALLAELDAALAQRAPNWMKMSGPKLNERIDMWVEKFDPTGVREPVPPRDGRYVVVGPLGAGMVGVWGKLAFEDGVAFDDRLDEIVATVCGEDPRTESQRRADALMAMAAGHARLECGCGAEGCPSAASGAAKPLGQVVIEVIAEQATIEGRSQAPGYAPGFGPIPAAMLREMAATAKLRPVQLPQPCAEQRYRPSAALARFVRCRDLTCRFPGCEAPAAVCEIDHTIPYPGGATHPSNLKLLCKFHHLVKTFSRGWSDRQLPDGTVVWTAPSGHTYTTKPGGALFFPQLAQPTGEIITTPTTGPPKPDPTIKMPRRRRTRAQDKGYRIASERQHNTVRLLRRQQLLAERMARDDEPPPF